MFTYSVLIAVHVLSKLSVDEIYPYLRSSNTLKYP